MYMISTASVTSTYHSRMPSGSSLHVLTITHDGVLKGIEYNSSIKGKGEYTNKIVSTNCESEKWDTEVEKDKKVSFDNVTNAG